MANRLTRVPDRPVPGLPRWVRPAVPVADLFMLAMVSRPRTGSLSRTWVTPATLQRCLAVMAVSVVAGGLVAARAVGGGRGAVALAAGLLLLALGAGAVALVGVVQRRVPPSA